MMLRSSSTPILGSLLSSSSSSPFFSESPNNNNSSSSNNHHQPLERTHSDSLNPKKLSLSSHGGGGGSSHTFSRHSSSSVVAPGGSCGFRRVRSDGNLQDLLSEHHDDLRPPSRPPPVRSSSRRPSTVLETIPSFSVYCSIEDSLVEEEGEDGQVPERSIIIGESISEEFRFSGDAKASAGSVGNAADSGGSLLFLARGLGIDACDPVSGLVGGFGCGAGGGSGGGFPVLVDNDGDQLDMEAYYRRMVEENPCSALFLRNYAQFLFQCKGDPERAEEYYSRAILAEPGDGEVLSQYAKLVWDLHRDHERASSYFEQAVQAAPQDSHVLAAYAGFLWEAEDEQVDVAGGDDGRSQDLIGAQVLHGALASASV